MRVRKSFADVLVDSTFRNDTSPYAGEDPKLAVTEENILQLGKNLAAAYGIYRLGTGEETMNQARQKCEADGEPLGDFWKERAKRHPRSIRQIGKGHGETNRSRNQADRLETSPQKVSGCPQVNPAPNTLAGIAREGCFCSEARRTKGEQRTIAPSCPSLQDRTSASKAHCWLPQRSPRQSASAANRSRTPRK